MCEKREAFPFPFYVRGEGLLPPKRTRESVKDALVDPTRIANPSRKPHSWKQEQTATQTGVVQATIARWEYGDRMPLLSQLYSLCCPLNAYPEKITALTTGQFALFALRIRSREERHKRIERCLIEIVSPLTLEDSRLWELEMIVMERELWHEAAEDQEARLLLARLYASPSGNRARRHGQSRTDAPKLTLLGFA